MNWLLIAGGAFIGALATPQEPDLFNHTLRGEKILAKQVVCRNMWGTPMPPDGKAGYSLIAPVNSDYVASSLLQPPKGGSLSTDFGVKETREFGIFDASGQLRMPSLLITPFRPMPTLGTTTTAQVVR